MGRPPIGKVAMTATERSQRYRRQHGTDKPATKPSSADTALARELAQAKARIAELEARAAHRSTELTSVRRAPTAEAAAQAGAEPPGKVFKILLKLDDANDNTVLVAARTLVRTLKANGSDIRTLAGALQAEWEKQQKAKPPTPQSIDWPVVEAAITRYAADKSKVTHRAVWNAVVAAIPAINKLGAHDAAREVSNHIPRCLRRLGFTASSSGLTWQRT